MLKRLDSIAIARSAALTLLLFFGFGLIAGVGPAFAQSQTLTLKAEAAYNGYFKYGEWLPVWVELQNQGADLEAEVRVSITSSQGTLVFSAPVALPSGSHKRMPVYVLPNNFSRELVVQLMNEGKVLASQSITIRPQPNISYMIGLLAPERGALSLLNGVKFPGQERPKILTDLSLDQLPDRAEGLRSFDLLVINDVDTAQMTAEQSAALSGWVQQGGHLVIGGGTGAQRTAAGLPAYLLPAKVSGTGEVNAETLKALADFAGSDPILSAGPFIAAQSQAADSQVLVGDSNLPLLLERSWGAGNVSFVAFDLAGIPFNGWPGTQSFWQALIGPAGSYPDYMPFDISPRQFRANQLVYPLSNIPSLDLPSIKGISILLGIYMLFVGPINYLVLRWRKRLHLAWVTIPILTALFTAGTFGIGYSLRGNDLILNKIALVQTQPNGTASVTSYMGLFSPRMQSYEVAVQGEGLISPMSGVDGSPWNSGPAPVSGGEMVFVQDQPAKVKGLSVNQWAMQSFMSEGTWTDFGIFKGDLRIENDNLVGTVRNDTGYTLKDVVITLQSRFQKLGDLAPGEQKDINLGLANLQSDRFGPPLSYRLYQQDFTNGPPPREMELKSNIVNSVFENTSFSKLASSRLMPNGKPDTASSVIIFGWLDQAPPDVTVADNRLSQKATVLVYGNLNYSLPQSGFLTVPAGLIPGTMTKVPSDGGNCGTATSVHMGKSQAEFEYQIPGNLVGLQINTLKLAISSDSGSMPGLPSVALYDWGNQSWVNLQDPIQGTNIIQNAQAYVNENGTARVQLNSQSDTFGCIYLDLGLEAERQASQGGSK